MIKYNFIKCTKDRNYGGRTFTSINIETTTLNYLPNSTTDE